jgi:hypothetical protein
MVFGYKDARPARFVDDRYEQAIFVQRLLKSCEGGRQDCGFKLDRDREAPLERLTKTINGPTGDPERVVLTVVHSSVGPDDETNRANPFQKWQSAQAQEQFEFALKNADVVFYNGHSRVGGGPDFFPPKLGRNEHVDYVWYKTHAKSRLAMERLLHESQASPLKVLGLFSCASDRLFANKSQDAKPGLGLISSVELIYFSDAIENSLAALSGLLEMKCRPEMDGILNASTELRGFLPKAD